jgi:hypothetical protein
MGARAGLHAAYYETKLFTLPGIEPRFLNPSSRTEVAVLTEHLYHLIKGSRARADKCAPQFEEQLRVLELEPTSPSEHRTAFPQ